MTEAFKNLGDIPTIGNSQIWQTSTQSNKNLNKPDVAMFDNAPSDVTAWSFFGKIFIGLAVWLCIVALLFWTLTAIGWLTENGDGQVNSMLKILLAVVWFIVQFVWSLALALMYNIFFSKKYYNFAKMFGLIFASSIIFLIFFLLIYLLFEWMGDLYVVLWFHVIFGLFISLNLMDFLSQPNYSATSLLWNTFWCILTVVVYLLVIRYGNFSYPSIAIISVLLSYILMILWSNIWDAIYYKLYEWWNNPFYLPSLSELREERKKEEKQREKEEEEVNVEMNK